MPFVQASFRATEVFKSMLRIFGTLSLVKSSKTLLRKETKLMKKMKKLEINRLNAKKVKLIVKMIDEFIN
jgi:hypothetical protein